MFCGIFNSDNCIPFRPTLEDGLGHNSRPDSGIPSRWLRSTVLLVALEWIIISWDDRRLLQKPGRSLHWTRVCKESKGQSHVNSFGNSTAALDSHRVWFLNGGTKPRKTHMFPSFFSVALQAESFIKSRTRLELLISYGIFWRDWVIHLWLLSHGLPRSFWNVQMQWLQVDQWKTPINPEHDAVDVLSGSEVNCCRSYLLRPVHYVTSGEVHV